MQTVVKNTLNISLVENNGLFNLNFNGGTHKIVIVQYKDEQKSLNEIFEEQEVKDFLLENQLTGIDIVKYDCTNHYNLFGNFEYHLYMIDISSDISIKKHVGYSVYLDVDGSKTITEKNHTVCPEGANTCIEFISQQVNIQHSLADILALTGINGKVIAFVPPNLTCNCAPNERKYNVYLHVDSNVAC
ncbi:hypothetical protein [Flavobacterium rhizosphaerae]|uniref:Uncharacterized protein n=1 Tax=Flavobacterium rhizosphaerae TaxID=3163298 RepID=A0ABW8YY43_9FLAO